MIYAVASALGVISACAVTALLIDAVPIFWRWQSRIHTGRMRGDEWSDSVFARCNSYSKRMPGIPLTDNERLTVVDRLRGQYKNLHLSEWQAAAVLSGCTDADAARELLKNFINPDGSLRNNVTCGTAMLLFAARRSEYIDNTSFFPASEETAAYLLESAGTGTLPYNKALPELRFVDAVGMVCPFLISRYLDTGDTAALELARRQLSEYLHVGLHPQLGIPVHCVNIGSSAPLGIYGWGRGCGWLALGLADSYSLLEQNESLRDTAAQLLECMEKYASDLLKFRLKNGGFPAMLGVQTHGESTATGMLGYMFAVLAEATGNAEYAAVASAAREFLCGTTRRDGKIDLAQGDTMGIAHYSSRFDVMPAAQGFACMLEKELRKL